MELLRHLRKLSANRKSGSEERVIKSLIECVQSNFTHRCLKKSLIHSEITGNPGEILISLGSLLLINPSVALSSLARVMADKEVEDKAGKSLSSLIRVAAFILDPYQVFNNLIESRAYVKESLIKELMSSSSCIDLVRIGEIINADSRVPLEYAVSYVREVMNRDGCLSGKEEGLKAVTYLLRQHKIPLKQLKELLGKKNLRILISRKEGRIDKVFLYLGDELIAEGADKDYVIDLLTLSSQLDRSSVRVYS